MRPERGAAPVAQLADLQDEEIWVVAAIRLWSEQEGAGNAALVEAVAGQVGSERGCRVLSLFNDLMALMADHARRPILRHKPSCSCVGTDEAVFVNFVSAATHGPREDAMLIATLLMRPDMAAIAVSLAQSLGLELRRGLARARSARRIHGVTLH